MMKKCVLCILYICTILNFRGTASRGMAPRITEPLKDINLQVEAGSHIDLCCSALLESEASVNATIVYWLINGSFIENISSVHEGSQGVSKKGDQIYVYIILCINDVIPELYNIPITCIANSPWGGDNSTLYLRAGFSKWKLIIPITLLCLLVLALLVAFIYKFTSMNNNPIFTFITHHSEM